jgi:hypothetical protein
MKVIINVPSNNFYEFLDEQKIKYNFKEFLPHPKNSSLFLLIDNWGLLSWQYMRIFKNDTYIHINRNKLDIQDYKVITRKQKLNTIT